MNHVIRDPLAGFPRSTLPRPDLQEYQMSRSRYLPGLAILAVPLLAACGDAAGPHDTTLMALSPPPAAAGVPTSTTLTFTFSRPMKRGMEQYVDLHQGGVDGPTVPMNCAYYGMLFEFTTS
jgi:hypothetical protein